ncbi:MAG TPA: phosphatidylserine/phosphatidylglycerophosphate/cardiolipin synthase family protein [Xanthobacteraceae bacterium]|nr:phosphatidylserine/phosphatidylglycerophosphate/cardiolipin synthase family protein [Xanthobacteraceae bacterium]
MTTVSAAGGDIDVMFLQQNGDDPFTASPERAAQAKEVATRISTFISAARSTLDVAIYDFRLDGEAAAIVAAALRDRAKNGVTIRIIYDATTEPAGNDAPAMLPADLEADKKAPGTETFIRSFADIAQIKPVTGYRVLMHSKYLVRDGASDDAAVFMGSANYTNDSWGLQENNLLQLKSRPLASYFSENFARLFATGRIPERPTSRDVDTVTISGITVKIAFAPLQSPAIVKEIVGAITGAHERLLVSSPVLSSGPILAALSEALDRGMRIGGLYDGPQMEQVRRQWQAAHVGADKINTWDKIADHLVRKNSLPYDRHHPHQPHNFAHNKLLVADDVVVTGSFNFSNHAMGNAENVLIIRDDGIASAYANYIEGLEVRYSHTVHPRRR